MQQARPGLRSGLLHPLLQSPSICLKTRGPEGGGAGSRRGPKTLENKRDPAKQGEWWRRRGGLAGSDNVLDDEFVTGVTSAVTRLRELAMALRKANRENKRVLVATLLDEVDRLLDGESTRDEQGA